MLENSLDEFRNIAQQLRAVMDSTKRLRFNLKRHHGSDSVEAQMGLAGLNLRPEDIGLTGREPDHIQQARFEKLTHEQLEDRIKNNEMRLSTLIDGLAALLTR